MQSFTAYDAKGRILWDGAISGKSDIQRQASHELGISIVRGRHDPATKWIDNGEVKDRPALDVAPPALVAGGSWQVSLPIGTEIAVVAEDGVTESTQTTDAETVEIAFEDAGTWALRLTPPFPYQPAEITIEVTDAD